MPTKDEETEANIYIAAVLIESSSDAPDFQPLHEERFVLVSAQSEQEAQDKAARLIELPYSYQNQYGETITCSLKEVVDVKPMTSETIIDGSELFYRCFRDYEGYRRVFVEKDFTPPALR